MPDAKLGINSKIYYNTGTYDVQVWVENDLISDLTRNAGWNKATYTTRRSRVEVAKPTTLNLTVSGKVRGDDDDPAFLSLYEPFLAAEVADFMILNGPKNQNGCYGWRCEWYVDQANEDQGLQTVLFEDFTLTPADEEHTPKSVLVVGGVPVFSEVAPVE